MKTKLYLTLFSLLCSWQLSAQAPYCTPTHAVTCNTNVGAAGYRDTKINFFSFNTLVNSTAACNTTSPGFGNFIAGTGNLTTSVYPGQSVPFSVQAGGINGAYVGIWIDWESDNDLGTAGNLVYTSVITTLNRGSVPINGYIVIPPGVTPGPKRLRVRCANSFTVGATFAVGNSCTGYTGETEDYTITVLPSAPMAYNNTSVLQTAASVFPGMTNTKVLNVVVNTTGNTTPVQLSQMKFNTAGTTNVAEVLSARLFYTALVSSRDSIMRPAQQVGTAVMAPNGSFTFTSLNVTLDAGQNNFWLTYDLDSAVVLNNKFDATCEEITVGGIPQTINAAPAGNLNTVAYLNYSYCAPAPVSRIPNTITGNNYGVGINRFTFETINNISADLDAYTFYPAVVPNIYRNYSYAFSGNAGLQSAAAQQFAMWIDWNNDGIFDPISEQAGYQDQVATFSGNISVPCSATVGLHRIRLVSDWALGAWGTAANNAACSPKPSPCHPLISGDMEEYVLRILPDPAVRADFSNDSIGYTSGYAKFVNKSTGLGNTYEWDFTEDNITDATTLHGRYRYNTPGWKKIKLTVTNNGCSFSGTTSYVDSIFIVDPVRIPTADFVASRNVTSTDIAITIFDKSIPGPYEWYYDITPRQVNGNVAYTYINGTDSLSPDPEVRFSEAGYYNITLVSRNMVGLSNPEVRTSYIQVYRPINMCGSDSISYEPSGFLYDDGGVSAAHAPGGTGGRMCTYLIKPCASEVVLNVSFFDLNNGVATACNTIDADFLKVYDGENNLGVPLHVVAGFPNGFRNGLNNSPIIIPVLKASTGKMYIEFWKNCAFEGAGFVMEWNSKPVISGQTPVIMTNIADTLYTNGIYNFASLTKGQNLSYVWDLQKNGSVESRDSAFLNSYNLPGMDSLRLIVTNCAGSDTLEKTFTILTPTQAPVADFTSDKTRIIAGEIVSFSDISSHGINSWSWSISPGAGVTFLNSSSNDPSPKVRFTALGSYDVELTVDNIVGSNTVIKPGYIEVIDYCQPITGGLSADIGISRVTLGDIHNLSLVGVNEYSDYLNQGSTILEQSQTYGIIIERNTTFDRMTRAVWIDWNADGDFEDAMELVAYQKGSRDAQWITNFTVPAFPGINFGVTKMRIGASLGYDTLLSCDMLTYGEYEDYKVVLESSVPLLTLNGFNPEVININSTWNDPGATATDYAGTNISSQIVVSGSVNTAQLGSYTLHYNITDNRGKKAAQLSRTVIVQDTFRIPLLTLIGSDTVNMEVFAVYNDSGAKAIDYDGNDISGTISVNSTAVNMSVLGTYVVHYQVSDALGKTATRQRWVVVRDTEAPVIILNGAASVTVQVGTAYNELGAILTENYWPGIAIVTSSTVNTDKLGLYVVTYDAVDGSGNHAVQVIRLVNVTDTVKPEIRVLGEEVLVMDVHSSYKELGALVNDNYDLNLQISSVLGSVDTAKIGDYILTYMAEDNSNNQAVSVIRTVRVVDRRAPVIVAKPIVVMRWKSIADVKDSVRFFDNYYVESSLRAQAQISGNFDLNLEGYYPVTITLTDSSGNVAIPAQTVILVVENTTGTGELQKEGFKVYPNPNSGQFTLEFTAGVTEADIVLYDQLGRVAGTWKKAAHEDKLIISNNDLMPGVYYILVTDSNGYTTQQKLVIRK